MNEVKILSVEDEQHVNGGWIPIVMAVISVAGRVASLFGRGSYSARVGAGAASGIGMTRTVGSASHSILDYSCKKP